MKTQSDYRHWIVGLALAGVIVTVPAQANPASASERNQADHRTATVDALVEGIRHIVQTDATTAAQHKAIAELVARTVVQHGPHAPRIVAGAAAQIDPALLPVVIAAATVAAGHRSPAMYQALLDAVGTTSAQREIVTRYARNPALALDPTVLATLPVMPMPSAVAPAPSLSDVHVGDIPLEVYERPVGEPTPPPPPPRPPAPPYRGQ